MLIYLGVFLLSASTLAFEVVLSRLFSISQFYHFAFMTVSLALLGAGASGAALSVFPSLRRGDPARRLSSLALLTALAALGSLALANWLPFDSFAIAWDRRQVLYLASMYLALSTPFFFGAMAVGWLLTARPDDAPRIYAANLVGSAAGCLLALSALAVWGSEGAAIFCAWLAGIASLVARPLPCQRRASGGEIAFRGRYSEQDSSDLTPRPPSLRGKGETRSPLLTGEGLGERSSATLEKPTPESHLPLPSPNFGRGEGIEGGERLRPDKPIHELYHHTHVTRHFELASHECADGVQFVARNCQVIGGGGGDDGRRGNRCRAFSDLALAVADTDGVGAAALAAQVELDDGFGVTGFGGQERLGQLLHDFGNRIGLFHCSPRSAIFQPHGV
jgi:hypothetical protein